MKYIRFLIVLFLSAQACHGTVSPEVYEEWINSFSMAENHSDLVQALKDQLFLEGAYWYALADGNNVAAVEQYLKSKHLLLDQQSLEQFLQGLSVRLQRMAQQFGMGGSEPINEPGPESKPSKIHEHGVPVGASERELYNDSMATIQENIIGELDSKVASLFNQAIMTRDWKRAEQLLDGADKSFEQAQKAYAAIKSVSAQVAKKEYGVDASWFAQQAENLKKFSQALKSARVELPADRERLPNVFSSTLIAADINKFVQAFDAAIKNNNYDVAFENYIAIDKWYGIFKNHDFKHLNAQNLKLPRINNAFIEGLRQQLLNVKK